MKTFICLVALAVTCHAGYDSLDNGGHNQDGGYQYTAPLVGNDFSSQGQEIAQGQSFGHDISGQGHDFSGGQGHVFSGGQGHDFSGGQGHDLSGGQGHDFSGGQGHDFSGGQGHDFSGGQGHGFSGGQGHDFSGGQGNDYTVALTGHGQNLGQNQFGLGHGHGPLLNNFGGDTYLQAAHDLGGHQEFSGSDGGQQGYGQSQGFLLEDGGHDFGHGGHDLSNVEAIPVGEHTDEEHPVEVPLYKHVTVPIHKPLHINVPKPILIGVPQPYPVKVPVHKPVAVPVETEISIPIEKPVPYPVVKHVPYPVEKHVPIRIEKTVTVHVPQPYPVKIPVYKTIHHHHKGHH